MPLPNELGEWEELSDTYRKAGPRTLRMRVPGGWLFGVYLGPGSVTFVPDPPMLEVKLSCAPHGPCCPEWCTVHGRTMAACAEASKAQP